MKVHHNLVDVKTCIVVLYNEVAVVAGRQEHRVVRLERGVIGSERVERRHAAVGRARRAEPAASSGHSELVEEREMAQCERLMRSE